MSLKGDQLEILLSVYKCQKPTVSMKTADQGLRLERQKRKSKLPTRFKDYHM